MHRKREKKHNRSGLQVKKVNVSSLIYGCLLPSWMYVCSEQWGKVCMCRQHMRQRINGTKSRMSISSQDGLLDA